MTPAERATLIANIEAQEAAFVLPHFDNDDAWQLGCITVDLARQMSAAVTVDIRRGGQQLFHCALPGTCADNDGWIDSKVRVVSRFAASSYLVGLRFEAAGKSFDADSRLDPRHYAAHGGSMPIAVARVGVVGTITVSGLPQEQDHALVAAALQRYTGQAPEVSATR